jgi:hypothetical protein
MKCCVIIPCHDHPATVAAVAQSAQKFCPVIVVDDGSSPPLPELPGCEMIRLEKNFGKGAALRAGFRRAVELGFTHAITMDADGQHFAEDLPEFLAAAETQPEALIVGVRNLREAGAPGHRQCSNAVSTFWFRVETGVRLRDTQCGFRSYPLALSQHLKTRSERYAFELEFMVRAAWMKIPIVAVPVKCTYQPEQIRLSHFRPVVDLARITTMNVGLVLQSWFVPQTLRAAWSCGEGKSLRKTVGEFFADQTDNPLRMALAVGLGLFFSLAPIWGFQMLAAAAFAHWLRLNKAIALLASNVSIPPLIPFIIYGALMLGHWMFTGQTLEFSPRQITAARLAAYFWQWVAGSLTLAAAVAMFGTMITYAIARLVRKNEA